MYAVADDVILTPATNGMCDWCDNAPVAAVEVWSAGRCLSYDDRACAAHVAELFAPAPGRIVTDHR